MESTQFCAVITVENCDSGKHCRLLYSAPESLDGLELELFCAPDGTPIGSATVKSSLGVVYTVSAASVEGLCRPLRALLQPDEIASLQKNGSDFLFLTANGTERLASPSGTPLSLASPALRFTIRWFQVK